MSAARFGTFRELIDDAEPVTRPIAEALRRLILDVHPQAVEVVRLGDRAATYGLGPSKMSEGHTYLMPQRDYVNLGFYRGALLDDPAGLLEGTGQAMRHVKVRSLEQVQQPALRRLVEKALDERRQELQR